MFYISPIIVGKRTRIRNNLFVQFKCVGFSISSFSKI